MGKCHHMGWRIRDSDNKLCWSGSQSFEKRHIHAFKYGYVEQIVRSRSQRGIQKRGDNRMTRASELHTVVAVSESELARCPFILLWVVNL